MAITESEIVLPGGEKERVLKDSVTGRSWEMVTPVDPVTGAAVNPASETTLQSVLAALGGFTVDLTFTGGINDQGAYVAETLYVTGDGVAYNGSYYVAKQNTTGNLPTDTIYWQVVAEKGAAGADGAAGAEGPQGPQGPEGPSGAVTWPLVIDLLTEDPAPQAGKVLHYALTDGGTSPNNTITIKYLLPDGTQVIQQVMTV
jgi:hypothetical protein